MTRAIRKIVMESPIRTTRSDQKDFRLIRK